MKLRIALAVVPLLALAACATNRPSDDMNLRPLELSSPEDHRIMGVPVRGYESRDAEPGYAERGVALGGYAERICPYAETLSAADPGREIEVVQIARTTGAGMLILVPVYKKLELGELPPLTLVRFDTVEPSIRVMFLLGERGEREPVLKLMTCAKGNTELTLSRHPARLSLRGNLTDTLPYELDHDT